MVRSCDLVLAHLVSDHGGTFSAVRYAKSLGKPILYIGG